jgi:hypothetical protein
MHHYTIKVLVHLFLFHIFLFVTLLPPDKLGHAVTMDDYGNDN